MTRTSSWLCIALFCAVCGVLPVSRVFAQSSGFPGDVTGDYAVDGRDIIQFINDYGTSNTRTDIAPPGAPDGRVDGYDFTYILANYGNRGVPPSTPPASASTPTPTPTMIPHRIGVANGKFHDRTNGQPFVPRGNSYVRLGPHFDPSGACATSFHSTFDVQLSDPCVQNVYSAQDAEGALGYMQWSGYNVVRVFINHEHAAGGGDTIDTRYIANIKDFVVRAKAHNIQVWFVLGLMPRSYFSPWSGITNIGWNNAIYLTRLRIEDKKRYLKDFINALKSVQTPMDAVFTYDIDSEIRFFENEAPFSLSSGIVRGADGTSTYDIGKPGEKDRLMSEGVVFFVNEMTDAVKSVDPTALVTASFFPSMAVAGSANPMDIRPRKAMMNPEEGGSRADFIDVHVYPDYNPSIHTILSDFDIPANTRKPIVMGEFGALLPTLDSPTWKQNIFPTLHDAAVGMNAWQVDSCQYGIDGWVMWMWDAPETTAGYYTVVQGGGAINGVLAPRARPDPCK